MYVKKIFKLALSEQSQGFRGTVKLYPFTTIQTVRFAISVKYVCSSSSDG